MSIRPLRTRDRFAILGIGLLCLPLLLAFGPYLEESRQESRAMQAYVDIRRFQERPDPVPSGGELDPWGNPYQVRRTANGTVRILSSGSNERSPVDGIDDDDVYSEMPVSPFQKVRRQKRLQWLIALAETAGVFLILATVYLSLRSIPE